MYHIPYSSSESENRDLPVWPFNPECELDNVLATLTGIERTIFILKHAYHDACSHEGCNHSESIDWTQWKTCDHIDEMQWLAQTLEYADGVWDCPFSLWIHEQLEQKWGCPEHLNGPDITSDLARQLYAIKIRAFPETMEVNLMGDGEFHSLSPVAPGFAVKPFRELELQLWNFTGWLNNFQIQWTKEGKTLEVIYSEEELKRALRRRLSGNEYDLGPRYQSRRIVPTE